MLNINYWKTTIITYRTYYIVSWATWFILSVTQNMMAARKRANQSRMVNKRKNHFRKCYLINIVLLPELKRSGIMCIFNTLMNFQKKLFEIPLIKPSDIFVSLKMSHLRPLFRSLHCFHSSRHIAGAGFNFITCLNPNIYREVYFPHPMCMKYIGRPAASVAVTYFCLEFSYNSGLLNKHTLTPHSNFECFPTILLLFSTPTQSSFH